MTLTSKTSSRIRPCLIALVVSGPGLLTACEAPAGAPPEIVALFDLATQTLESIGLVPAIQSKGPRECEDNADDC
jgi:hypothetical protein